MRISYIWEETQQPVSLAPDEETQYEIAHVEHTAYTLIVHLRMPEGPTVKRVRWTLEADVPLNNHIAAGELYTTVNATLGRLSNRYTEIRSWHVDNGIADLYPEDGG